jgi:hypothetical protein
MHLMDNKLLILKLDTSPNLNGDVFTPKVLVEAYLNHRNNLKHTDKPSSFIAAPVAPAQEEHGESQEKKA